MAKDDAKKTMRFWILTGIIAIAASQIPMLLKKGIHPEDDPSKDQQKKKPKWMLILMGAVFVCFLLWLFDYLM